MSKSFKTGASGGLFHTLLKEERDLIAKRRVAAGVENSEVTTGLALSGGGIRSATFCLGVLQALSERGLMPRFDYLSTVSGGSYIGGFFGALFVPETYRATATSEVPRKVFDKKKPLQSALGLEAVRRLRDSGRYLTPSGTSDAFYGAAVVMRNWAAVQTVIGITLLMFLWAVRMADGAVLTAFGHSPDMTGFWYSPALLFVSWLSLAFLMGFGSSYWLTRRDWIPGSRLLRVISNLYFWMALILNGFCGYLVYGAATNPQVSQPIALSALCVHVSVFLTISLLAFFYAELRVGRPKVLKTGAAANDYQFLIAAEDRVRSKLSDWLSTSLIIFLSLVVLSALDVLGYAVMIGVSAFWTALSDVAAGHVSFASVASLIGSAWPVLVAAVPPLFSYIARRQLRRHEAEKLADANGTKLEGRNSTVFVLAGSIVVGSWVILWSAGTHWLFPKVEPFGFVAFAVLIALAAVNIGQSLCFSFINLSSLSTFYAARLRRAYLGASSYGNKFTNVRQDDPEDTIRVEDYYYGIVENGAPLHLINLTIAETIAGTSNLVARDRKGKPMHLSPGGIIYEGDEPGTFCAGRMNDCEELPLANWIAISGAAVSAAIGSGTSLGTSILATMANVRLGYWWKARHAEDPRDFLWANPKDNVQNYLFLELRGAFDGTRRDRWYLTDGGHFENTGIYSLLQREVDYIVACDNGADPTYDMVDILRLVQRSRIDLRANITFLDKEALDIKLGSGSALAGVIGTFADLAKLANQSQAGGPVATIAEIAYESGKKGTLLLIKPRLTFTEPPELLAYRRKPGGKDFPQQTTGDQFFDEEQWEAYRRLGEYWTERLFATPSQTTDNHWFPASLKP
ncbi:patatin-like phospholipase family protein [Rhizobium sp. LjRoot98]|uniref:patatin-like phospholipase family protein n=1 Tax=Rhizobium sp. LjRoot98 TaxID=3342345 RepID=UPI003ECDC14E